MKNIIFIAPPAAGKGTISEMIEDKYKIPHISTGALLREFSNRNDELGKEVKTVINSGGLVNGELMIKLIKQRITQQDCYNGFILDGFPRNVPQAELYDELLQKLNKDLGMVILLEINKETAMKRIVGRVSCPKCNKVYNTTSPEMAPKQTNKCDECGSELITRTDDNEETFNKRFSTYLRETQPLIEYYENKGNLYKIDSSGSTRSAFQAIEELIND